MIISALLLKTLKHWDEDFSNNAIINHMNNVNDVIKKCINHSSKKKKKYQKIFISSSNYGLI